MINNWYEVCPQNQSDYNDACCEKTEASSIRHLAFVKEGYQGTLRAAIIAAAGDADLEDVALTTGMLAGQVIRLRNIVGEYDGASDTVAEGFGDLDERVTSRKHKVTFEDWRIVNNTPFYNSLRRSSDWVLWLGLKDFIWNTGSIASFKPKKPIKKEKTGEILYMIEATWVNMDDPEEFVRPATFFKCDPQFTIEFISRVTGAGDTWNLRLHLDNACTGGGNIQLIGAAHSVAGNVLGFLSPINTAITNNQLVPLNFAHISTLGDIPAGGTLSLQYAITGCGLLNPVIINLLNIPV
jgi:hypothetical protein